MRFFKTFFFFAFIGVTFLAGYYLTDLVFRVKKIPYPFEFFGLAAGLGLASWTFSMVHFIGLKFSKGGLR